MGEVIARHGDQVSQQGAPPCPLPPPAPQPPPFPLGKAVHALGRSCTAAWDDEVRATTREGGGRARIAE